jgi:pimeloyl-ACP methyl ester carboxylesterase
VTVSSVDYDRSRAVEEAFASLPERYRGADDGFEARYHVRLDDVDRTWEVELTPESCVVHAEPRKRPDVVIATDAETWLELRDGRLSGLDAYSGRRLSATGNLDLAIAFEGLFHLPNERPPLLHVHEVDAGQARISTLTAGSGDETVLLIHGLGGNKTSFFETISGLAPRYTVHAIDLPGFGSSSKPPLAPYDAPWFGHSVVHFMDAMGIERAHLVGNSLGGRIALEVGLNEPSRVATLSLLCPSLAWRRHREFAPLVRLLRPELAAIPHPLGARRVRDQFWSLFARPERLDPSVAEVASREFLRIYRSPAARIAFYKAARSIYLEEPFGDAGFWTTLAHLEPPALFVWGEKDRLVPAAFSRHVADVLPDARQLVLNECGHVPQVELPDQTNKLLREYIHDAPATATATHARIARLGRRAWRRVRSPQLATEPQSA